MRKNEYAIPEGNSGVQDIDQVHCVFCKWTIRSLKENNRRIIDSIKLGDMTVEGHCCRCVNSLIEKYYPHVPFV